MNSILIALLSLGYLGLLFGIAWWVEQRRKQNKSVVNNGWIYALSLAVYCTGWTYYGSVGRATSHGIDFITIYLGPSVMCALFVPVLQKIIRICKSQRINSIADFIASRYGKNFSLGIVVTVCCIIGVLPYIALQLKAISYSFHAITNIPLTHSIGLHDDTLYITIVIIFFIIVFGTRSIDTTERHEGLVAAVAFESLIKLFAFLIVGIFVTYFIFNGFKDIFNTAVKSNNEVFLKLNEPATYSSWFSMLLVSMFAIVLLPRQFQVSVVENTNEKHLKKAAWLFPVYLLAINIFVVPIAIAGTTLLNSHTDPDMFVLALPLELKKNWLSILVYIGGFSAATSMIIVETIALSTMVSNHLIVPFILSRNSKNNHAHASSLPLKIITSRRITIAAILLSAYLYNAYISHYISLVSIGLASMAAVAQFAPAVIGGLYWRNASQKGALAGIIIGFAIWFYALILPSGINAGFLSQQILVEGPWGISWLRPTALFGLEGLDPLSHALFWSLLFNCLTYLGISSFVKLSPLEIYQAKLFVDIFNKETNVLTEGEGVWKGQTQYGDLQVLLQRFLGEERANFLLIAYAKRHNINISNTIADPRMVSFSERILSGIIGSASAKLMVSSIVKRAADISIKEVLSIVRESQQVLVLNKELKKKSAELIKATNELQTANEQLLQIDNLKNEFLYTVTHELRTPLTSIRALSEILYDNPEMDEDMRQHYLEGITTETERLSHLITQVLNLERYESGRQKLNTSTFDLNELCAKAVKATQQLADNKTVQLNINLSDPPIEINADWDLLHQVLYNLLTNAIKFAPEKSGIVSIKTALWENETLKCTISDNGPGITDSDKELVFDKFFQAHNQTLKKPIGSGLGLAICKRIIDMHNGHIWVEDALGNGACFAFTIPVDAAMTLTPHTLNQD